MSTSLGFHSFHFITINDDDAESFGQDDYDVTECDARSEKRRRNRLIMIMIFSSEEFFYSLLSSSDDTLA